MHFRNYIKKIFDYLKVINSYKNFIIFFTLVIKKLDLYNNIFKKNI